MKALLILLTVLNFGATALANTESDDQINSIEMDVILDTSVDNFYDTPKIEANPDKDVARLYKFENSRIKKALLFKTKKTKAKLA